MLRCLQYKQFQSLQRSAYNFIGGSHGVLLKKGVLFDQYVLFKTLMQVFFFDSLNVLQDGFD